MSPLRDHSEGRTVSKSGASIQADAPSVSLTASSHFPPSQIISFPALTTRKRLSNCSAAIQGGTRALVDTARSAMAPRSLDRLPGQWVRVRSRKFNRGGIFILELPDLICAIALFRKKVRLL